MGKVIFSLCVSVHTLRGGTQSQVQVGGFLGPGPDRGVPGPGPSRGGSQVQVQVGGVPGPGWGGYLVSGLGGYPVSGLGGVPVSVKGKFFDTRFGLIHVQTGETNFLSRDLPPPVKGKIFDTRFGLIHVQTREKIFCQGTPSPPPGIARTCYGYAAGGMPLAFTQKDFLVVLSYCFEKTNEKCKIVESFSGFCNLFHLLRIALLECFTDSHCPTDIVSDIPEVDVLT